MSPAIVLKVLFSNCSYVFHTQERIHLAGEVILRSSFPPHLVIFLLVRWLVACLPGRNSEVRTASIVAMILEAVRISETSVYLNETTWR